MMGTDRTQQAREKNVGLNTALKKPFFSVVSVPDGLGLEMGEEDRYHNAIPVARRIYAVNENYDISCHKRTLIVSFLRSRLHN